MQVPEVRFPVAVTGGVPVVTAPEEIDITSAESLRAALLEADARARRIRGRHVPDRFCDSSGLHALVAAHRHARAEDGEVLLVIPDTAVLRVFALTDMDRVIPNFASLAEALAQAPATRAAAAAGSAAMAARDRVRGLVSADMREARRDDAAIPPVPHR